MFVRCFLGFKPTTFGLLTQSSDQLSYRNIFNNTLTVLKTLLIVWAQTGFLFPTSKSKRTARILCWILSSPTAVKNGLVIWKNMQKNWAKVSKALAPVIFQVLLINKLLILIKHNLLNTSPLYPPTCSRAIIWKLGILGYGLAGVPMALMKISRHLGSLASKGADCSLNLLSKSCSMCASSGRKVQVSWAHCTRSRSKVGRRTFKIC